MKNSFLLQLIKYGIAFQLLIFILFPSLSWGQCNYNYNSYIHATSGTTVRIETNNTFSGNHTIYWEYGPSGFTPGFDSLPGVGGSIQSYNFTGPLQLGYSFGGLTAGVNYDMYSRKKCSNGSYTLNSAKETIYMYDVCAAATALPCGQSVTPVFPSGYGGWSMSCGGYGREKPYSVSPAAQGNFIVTLYPSPISVSYYYGLKDVNYCEIRGYTCLGSNSPTDTIRDTITNVQNVGTYYFLAKSDSIAGGTGGKFRVDCPCLPPTNIAISNITLTSALVSYTGGNAGTIIELDTLGNAYGSGPFPGPHGIIINGGSSGTFITGLTPGHSYYIYVRNLCSGTNYSYNANGVPFSTLSCPQIYNYTSFGSQLSPNAFSHVNPNTIINCYGDSLNTYPETFVKFTPFKSGTYYITLNRSSYDLYFAFRQTNNTCNFSNFMPLCSWTANTPFQLNLTAGITYDFFLEPVNQNGLSPNITISGINPSNNATITNVQSHNATLNFTCNCVDSCFIEYGPTGFVPGTANTAGVGGTLVYSTSPFILSGLNQNTEYTVYIRNYYGGSYCTGNIWCGNFRTRIDCSTAPTIFCGDTCRYINAPNESGYWYNYNCGLTNVYGIESLYQFTPLINSSYKFRCTQTTAGSQVPISVYYKLATGTCDSSGWNCLGTIINPGDSLLTNLLSANSTYLILMDAEYGSSNFTKSMILYCQCTSTPSTPASITGLIKPCPGATGIIYNISSVANANSYTWNVPAGATIVSGAGTNSITVNYDSTFVSGDITVTADNLCGSSAARIKSVSRNVPNTPPGIIGTEYGLCGGKTTTYSINVSSLTNTYLWSVPSGVTINSGQGTKNISVTFPANFSPATISVKAGNSCGYGNSQTLVVNATPKAPTIINGPNTVCVNQTGVIYTISSSSNKTTYNWGVPTGSIITSGQGTSAIKMNFGTIAGDITVNTANACGAGSNRILSVAIVCREGVSTMNDLLDVNIYPNPSNNYFTVDAHFTTEGNYNLIVRDILGRVVEIYSNINYQQSFNFGKTLHTGIYFIEVSKGNERQVLRVVKSE